MRVVYPCSVAGSGPFIEDWAGIQPGISEPKADANVRLPGRAVFVHVPGVAPRADAQIDIRVVARVLIRLARTDFEAAHDRIRAIDQMVAVAVALGKRGAFSGPQDVFANIIDQRHLTLQHPHEFVFGGMPVALARPCAGSQFQEIDAEVGEASRIAEPASSAVPAGLVEWWRVAAARTTRQGFDVDCGHDVRSSRSPAMRSVRRFLLFLVAQFAPENLAYIALGQFLAELDVFGTLVTGQFVVAILLERGRAEGRILLHHEQLHHLAGMFVGHADRGDLQHAGMARDDVLYFV